jgi:solute:Na+ symporter, SSS family
MSGLTLFTVLFVVLMLVVGVVASKKIKSTDDFFVGGRKVHPILIISTLVASEVGGGAMLAATGLGYASGWGVMWYIAPFAVGAIVFAFIFAERLKREGDKYGSQSMFDWLGARFDNAVSIRIVGGLVMLFGLFGALASQFVAIGTALNEIGDISVTQAILIGGIVIIIYASLGGIYSVMWTDLLQGLIFIFGMVVLLPMLMTAAGGFSAIRETTPPAYWTMFPRGALWHFTMLATMIVAPFVRQYYYQRMFASNSPSDAKRSMAIQSVALILVPLWAALVGMAIFTINPNLPNAEVALPWALSELLPPAVGALVLGAIIAAIMSTGDTFLNACALTFIRDVYKPMIGSAPTEEGKMLGYAKIATVVIGVISLVVALFSRSIIGALMNAWAILGGGLFVPMVFGYFWKKANRQGILASMVSGLVVTFLFNILKTPVPAIFVGLAASFIGLFVGSLVSGAPAPAEEAA